MTAHDPRTQAAVEAGHPEWVELPVSRVAARLKSPLYFTGKPCKHGHVAPRRNDGSCAECHCQYMRKHRRTENGRAAERRADTKWRSSVKGRAYQRAWEALREEKIARATPPWLTSGQHDEIRSFYETATSRNEPHHVDHIIPLSHPDVCGLHVPWNMQVLPAVDNLRKSNTFDGTLENEGWRS